MLRALAEYNTEHEKVHNEPLSIGVGVHKGRVRLGTIGESGRMDGTVISDAAIELKDLFDEVSACSENKLWKFEPTK